MDTEYILDCAGELGEVTPLEGVCLFRLQSAYDAVRQLVDANQMLPQHFLENTARATYAQQEQRVQHWVALETLSHFREALHRVVLRANAVVQHKVQCALGYTQPSPFSDLLGVSRKEEVLPIQADSEVTEGLVRQVLDDEFGRFKERLGADVQAIQKAVAWYQADGGREYAAVGHALGRSAQAHSLPPTSLQLARQAISTKRTAQKRAKSAIKKATKLFGQLGQSDNLRLMVQGQEVTLEHEDSPLKFLLRPSSVDGWLFDRTVNALSHTPYELSVWTKEDVFVAKLCVLMDNTPVLDQLLAMTLFVKSGEELEILTKANWFGFGEPLGKETVLQHYPELAVKFPQAAQHEHYLMESAFDRQQAHWRPFEGRVTAWIETWLAPVVGPALELVAPSRQAAMALSGPR